jgi:hypothetical protein
MINAYKLKSEKLKEGDHLKNQRVYESIILKLM